MCFRASNQWLDNDLVLNRRQVIICTDVSLIYQSIYALHNLSDITGKSAVNKGIIQAILVFNNTVKMEGPLARYVKLRVAHAPEMPGTFSPPPRLSNPNMHHGMCVTHVPWRMPGSLTSGFLWSRWRGKRSRHSRRMHNPQFYVSGKRPRT